MRCLSYTVGSLAMANVVLLFTIVVVGVNAFSLSTQSRIPVSTTITTTTIYEIKERWSKQTSDRRRRWAITATRSDASDETTNDEKLNNISKPPDNIMAGSQDELMYALGVNLARQLGDITPLVENGSELAQVAKGLLDTIVGRLTEEGQRELLLRRGTELNAMIMERA